MTHEYRPYPQTYRPGLRARWAARFSDAFNEIYGSFWNWFWDELTLRKLDRFAERSLTFVLTVIALYVGCLVVYEVAVVIAIAYGVWPQW